MLHGILVDGMIERIEGNPEFAGAEVVRLRVGSPAEYLFGVLEPRTTFAGKTERTNNGGQTDMMMPKRKRNFL